MSFKDKVVVVTGASSGIGAGIAEHFAKEGANVVMVARNETKLQNVAKRCAAAGPEPFLILADVADDAAAASIIQKTIEKYNRIDVLVNNAGIGRFGTILGGNLLQVYDETVKVNLRAVIHLTSLAAPHLIKTKGNIINISSAGSLLRGPGGGLLSYTTTKAALNHFTRGVALELAPHGVRVNVVCPGPVYSDILENASSPIKWTDFEKLTALNRVAEPQEIADLVAFLASDKAKSITGSNFVSDNGMLLKRS